MDENNKSLLKDQDEIQLYGAYGENYMTEQKTFEGYELANVEGPTEGIFNETIPTIIFYYKNPSSSTKKQDPTENADNKGKNEPREDQSSDDTQPIQMTVKVQKDRCKKECCRKLEKRNIRFSFIQVDFYLLARLSHGFGEEREGK